MRNVPVGAGRRKNKNSSSAASHYRQIMVPDTLQNGSLHSAVLTFGSDFPLCDSMASVLSLAEKAQNGVLNGFHSPKHNVNNNNTGDDINSVGASVMASSLSEKRDNATTSPHEESVDKIYHQGFSPQLCLPGSSSSSSSSSPWPYPWNPAMTPSAFYQPVSFYPTPAFWRCMPPPPSWSVNYQSAPTSGPNSPTLGKHSREGDILFQKPGTESSNTVLIPKTLRIDDPTEAAKSSIWSTLGIKNEKGNSLNGGGLFKAFASKGGSDDKKNHVVVEASPVLQANPAALSRSLVFRERT